MLKTNNDNDDDEKSRYSDFFTENSQMLRGRRNCLLKKASEFHIEPNFQGQTVPGAPVIELQYKHYFKGF